jgi:hypothetical protein
LSGVFKLMALLGSTWRSLHPRGNKAAAPISRSEIHANLLSGLDLYCRLFSECVLMDGMHYLDFDSAIPRFESWRPSQPVRSSRRDIRVCENRRHFSWLGLVTRASSG